MADSSPHVLVVEARYYEDISEELARGAVAALDEAGCTYDRIEVAGALEIPAAIAIAHAGAVAYDGYVALGCVIRGETSHYDIVAGESARALMDLAVGHRLAIGNGILTVETSAQAFARARVAEKNKGGFAASACLDMIALRGRLMAGPGA
jgi:6,7-dimethyl-8-ribityllumazine synthase